MAKPTALVKVDILSPAAISEARSLVPKQQLEQLKFYKQLTPEAQRTLKENLTGFAAAVMAETLAPLAQGAYLLNIQSITKPVKGFEKFLANYRIPPMTARRLMEGYNNMSSIMSPLHLKAASARNLKIVPGPDGDFGKYTEAIKRLGPFPKNTSDTERAMRDIDKIVEFTKEKRSRVEKAKKKNKKAKDVEAVIGDPTVLLKSSFRQAYNSIQRLPNNAKSRRNWIESLFGMLMTAAGIQSAQSFKPEAIPDGYVSVLGRPTLEKENEEKSEAATGS